MNVDTFIHISSAVLMFILAFLIGANLVSIALRLFKFHRLAEQLQFRLAGFISLFRIGIR